MDDEVTKTSQQPARLSIDSSALGRQVSKSPLRKRFYATVEVVPQERGFAIGLDGRVVMTPAKARLLLPTAAAAEAVAEEWRAQKDEINPDVMPLTRIVNSALDGVAQAMAGVTDEIVKYAETDLICYRAGDPQKLVAAQAAAWDPILSFVEAEIGARFFLAEGIIHVTQPPTSIAAVRDRVLQQTGSQDSAPIALACLSVMTTLTGSVLIPLALVGGAVSLEQAWGAAHVDEDFQISQWGADAEAMERRARRLNDMEAANRLWRLVHP
jgi:chaperone required for assembly of F1-ATPase